ncbi:DUF2971 domain-containing protein [Achromobacter sp. EB05]|uniref:DUF2971 domain-containing protein n=1 Tax=Achromobacter sp. EB05 TaxID=3142974 RepID=UPI00378372F4
MNICLGPGIHEDTAIARYMSLPAFLYMIQFGQAFLPSIANLRSTAGNQGDPTEGIWGVVDQMQRDGSGETLRSLIERLYGLIVEGKKYTPPLSGPTELQIPSPFGLHTISREPGALRAFNDKECRWLDAWCWHRFRQEHMSMWRQYGAGDGAVCILTTVGRLLNSMTVSPNERAYVGKMLYTRPLGLTPRKHEQYSLFLQKMNAYEYEREIRILVYDPKSPLEESRAVPGRYVPIDMKMLCDAVLVHPDAPVWIFELVTEILESRFGRGAMPSSIQIRREGQF